MSALRTLLASTLVVASGCYAAHDPYGDAGISPVTEPCPTSMSGSRRDCDFRVERVVTCRTGVMQAVGCGCEGLGSCSGDPVLRICEGSGACLVSEAIDNVDDRCGLCPSVDFECPPSGLYTILSAPFGSSSYRCDVEVRGGS